MKKTKRILAATLLAGMLVLTACNTESAPNGENGAETTPESSETQQRQ